MNVAESFAAGIAMLTVSTVICDWFSEEIHARLERLPLAVIKAVLRAAPPDVRAEEWKRLEADLAFIWTKDDGLPVTRLVEGLGFALRMIGSIPRYRSRRTPIGTASRLLVAAVGLSEIGWVGTVLVQTGDLSWTWLALRRVAQPWVPFPIHVAWLPSSLPFRTLFAVHVMAETAATASLALVGAGLLLAAVIPEEQWVDHERWRRCVRVARLGFTTFFFGTAILGFMTYLPFVHSFGDIASALGFALVFVAMVVMGRKIDRWVAAPLGPAVCAWLGQPNSKHRRPDSWRGPRIRRQRGATSPQR